MNFKNIYRLFFISGVILILTQGCKSGENINHNEYSTKKFSIMKDLEKKLKEAKYPGKEDPFVLREFTPYLNGMWIGNAVSYGCYRKGQAPGVKGPSETEILEDLQIVTKYWNLIRVYGADDDSERILKVIKDHNLPVKVMLGVWVENETNNPVREKENITQAVKAVVLANEYKEIVAAVNVGNETQVFWSAHKMEMNDLIKYLRFVRNNTSVPVTTADDYNFWNKPESKIVANEVDFIVVHIYPLWNGQTLENSIEWLDRNYHDVKKIHSGKMPVLGEIGWATDYDATKTGEGQQGSLIKGEVGLKAQEQFLIKLTEWVSKNGVTTFLFEAFDEPWKGGGENSSPREIEKHWGVFYENRTPKESFKNYLKNSPEYDGKTENK